MRSVYTRILLGLETHFLACALTVLLLCTLFLQPTLAARFNQSEHHRVLNEFIHSVVTSQAVSPQTFWQFRHVYSPGYFTINEAVIAHGQTYTLEAITEPLTPLLTYHSPAISSTDSLIQSTTDFESAVQEQVLPEVLVASETLSLSRDTTTRKIQLTFIAPTSAMREANGFFDYTAQEQKLLENTHWYNTTTITY